jgi:putative ABC transport system substrate-binding protein
VKARRLIAAAGLLALSIGEIAHAAERVYRIGFLGARSRSTPAKPDIYYDAWLNGMRELGYVEGKNLNIEWRFAEGYSERLPGLATELAAMKLDAIVSNGAAPTIALHKATSITPIVFIAVVDPVGIRVVQSLGRPGGNITGLSLMAEDLNVKRVELLKQLVPSLSGLAVLVNPENPNHSRMIKIIENAATAMGVKVLSIEASRPDQYERAICGESLRGFGGLLVLEDPFLTPYWGVVARAALRCRLPSISYARELVEAGGLVCYGTNLLETYRRTASLVDKVLKGAKPADIPIEQPTKIELLINNKTATALGLTIPPELLVQADKVIE